MTQECEHCKAGYARGFVDGEVVHAIFDEQGAHRGYRACTGPTRVEQRRKQQWTRNMIEMILGVEVDRRQLPDRRSR